MINPDPGGKNLVLSPQVRFDCRKNRKGDAALSILDFDSPRGTVDFDDLNASHKITRLQLPSMTLLLQ